MPIGVPIIRGDPTTRPNISAVMNAANAIPT
jgi:hypothetical protein